MIHFLVLNELVLIAYRISFVVVGSSGIVVFGGFHSDSIRLNDVWVLDTDRMMWSNHGGYVVVYLCKITS